MQTSSPLRAAASQRTPGKLLFADHARLEMLMTELLACAEEGDCPSVVAPWRALETGLLAHMAFEEADLFPAFAKEHAPEVELLLAQHRQLRSDLDRLGLAVELHEARLEPLRTLIARLRAHADAEDRLFYPWVDRSASAALSQVIRDRFGLHGGPGTS